MVNMTICDRESDEVRSDRVVSEIRYGGKSSATITDVVLLLSKRTAQRPATF